MRGGFFAGRAPGKDWPAQEGIERERCDQRERDRVPAARIQSQSRSSPTPHCNRSVSSGQCGGSKRALRLALARRDLVAARDHEAGVPSGCPLTAWRLDRLRIEAGARDQPGDNRVRVPHLACAQLIASPHWRWYVGRERKQSTCSLRVVAQVLGTVDRLGDVRDDAVAPAAYLVAEDSEPPCPMAADRSFGDNAAVSRVAGTYRRLLAYVTPLWDNPHSCTLVEGAHG